MRLKEFAQHLKLSPTTVSRALAGYSDVSDATRERVIGAARELGYHPNRAAQGLRAGRAHAIGLVLPTTPQQFASPFFSELIAGLGEGLAEHNLDLLVSTCPPGPLELACYQRLIRGRRVDGAVIVRARVHDERVALLERHGVPFVVHGRTQDAASHAYLEIDGEHGFHEATRFLLQLGHRRIALINAPGDLNISVVRHAGYRRALREAGLGPEHELLVYSDLTEDSGQRAAQQLLALPEPPSAILCANDLIAFGAMHAIRERRLRVGRDVSVIGYDDVPFARFSDPPLTTLHSSSREAGKRLAEMLTELLQGASPQALQELWTPRLLTRSSHGPAKAAPSTHPPISLPRRDV